MTYPVPTQNDGTLIDDDKWNAHVAALNDLNTRLGTGGTGDAVTRLAALEAKVFATGTTGVGNDTLSSRLGTGVTTSNTATSQLNAITGNLGAWSGGTAISRLSALESAVGIPWSGGTALSRIQAIEGRAKGAWQAPNSSQTINAGAYGGSSANDVLIDSVVTAPTGITTSTVSGGTVFTVGSGHDGWYHLSFQFDIAIASPGQVNLTIQNSASSVSYGTHEAFFPGSPSWTIGTAHALVFLAAGATFKGTVGVFLSTGAAVIANANSGPGVARTHMRAVRVA